MLYNRCAGNMVNDESDETYCLDSGLSGINWTNFYKANTIMSNSYKRELSDICYLEPQLSSLVDLYFISFRVRGVNVNLYCVMSSVYISNKASTFLV